MALIAWYKLEDLTDNSKNQNHLTYINDSGKIVSSNEGKIGGCYRRSTAYSGTDILRSREKIHLQGDFTISCWAKVTNADNGSANGLVTNHSHSTNTGAGITVYQASTSDYRISCNTGTGTGRTYNSYYGTTNIKDKWSFLLLRFIKEANQLSLWVDGIKEKEFTYAQVNAEDYIEVFSWSTSHSSGSGAYKPATFIDDVRIYDHALSEKEIQELAKAKVLHYKFDDFQEPTENLWTGNLSIYNNYGVPASLTATGETFKGEPVYRLAMTVDDAHSSSLSNFQTSLYSHGVYGGSRTFKANTKYAISIFWKPVNKHDVVFGGTASNISGFYSGPTEYLENGWRRYTRYRNGTVTEDKTDNIHHSFYCPSLRLNETIYIDVCAPQTEEGKDYSTPYVKGVREGIVKDSSGYDNHATLALATTPKWVKDSVLGSGAYEFDGSTNFIPIFTTDVALTTYTATGWFYRTDNSGSYGTILGNIAGGSNFEFETLKAGSGTLRLYAYNSSVLSTSYDLNKWNFFALVRDPTNQSLYLNGNLIGTESSVARTIINTLQIGRWNTSQYYKGKVDDVRIYATALTAEQVKELYNTRGQLDNKGNLFINRIKELPNIGSLINKAIKNRTFTNGLSSYTQANCQITLTDNGYRIYRPPNLDPAVDRNTMWGGMRIQLFNNEESHLKKGRKYRISFTVTGKSSNIASSGGLCFSNNMGWSGGGLTNVGFAKGNNIPIDFDGTIKIVGETNILDDIYKVCTSSYSSFVEGQYYNCYRDLCFGFSYTKTGDMGTDIYITDFEIQDITDESGVSNISEKGILKSLEISELGITNGLVAYYPLNGNAKDYTMNRNDGVVNGATVASGINGKLCYEFDGVDDYIETGIPTVFSSSFSVSMWVNPNASKRGILFGDYGLTNTVSVNFELSSSNKMRFYWASSPDITGTTSLATNTWSLITFVRDKESNKVLFYINNELDYTYSDAITDKTAQRTFYLGRDSRTGATALQGGLQNVRIYNRALSPEEIATLYDLEKPNPTPMKLDPNTVYVSGEFNETL